MKQFSLRLLILFLAALSVSAAEGSFLIDPAGGTVLWGGGAGADDAVIRGETVGFDFNFFGEVQATIDVSTNGNLNFSGDASYSNELLAEPVLRISPLWDDLEIVAGSGDAVTEKVVPGKYYSVTWKVHEHGSTTQHAFQVVLFGAAMRINGLDFAPDDIVFSYETIGPTFAKDTATVGLDAGDGSTVVTLPGASADTGILPHAEAGLLPVGAGGFVLFRPDDSGDYVAATHINHLPQAADDMLYSSGRASFPIDVLANDSDPDGDPLTILSVTQGLFGNVMISGNAVTYMPGPGFVGSDTFNYTVRDPYGFTDTARVTLLPFAAGKGVFDGLIADAPDDGDTEPTLTNEGSGFLKFTLSAKGAFSGTIRFGGLSQPLRGAFDARGDFTTQYDRVVDGEKQTVIVTLHLDLSDQTHPLTGTVTDGTVTSTLTAARSRYVAGSFSAPQAGKYSVLLNPDPDLNGPPGLGYALMNVTAGGAVALAGKRGDGKNFTFGSFVKTDGTFPFQLSIPAGKGARAGSLFGLVKFDETQPASDCSSALLWFMPDVGDVTGFEAAPQLVGSRYRPPADGTRVIALTDGPQNAMIDLNDSELTDMLTITARNKVRVNDSDTEQLTLKINTGNGIFTGCFFQDSDGDPPVRQRRAIGGVFLQKSDTGGGLYLGTDGSAAVRIGPPILEQSLR